MSEIDPVDNIRNIDLGDEYIILDPKKFQFNDATLNKFMEEVSIWYDYYSSKSAKAEELMLLAETQYETLYLAKFLEGKQSVSSDKAADAFARSDLTVQAAHDEFNKYKVALKHLKEYLKSFDKAHSMAQNRCYSLRKEMDKLGGNIYQTRDNSCDISDIIDKIKDKDKDND